jgi:hypothetical protein
MSSSISGWVVTRPAGTGRSSLEADLASAQPIWWSWRPGRSDDKAVWIEVTQGNILRDIAALRENWDAAGAHKIGESALGNARTILNALSESGYSPDSIFPNPAATIEFEWERPSGSARLEIGNSRFAFYTVPSSGNSIMRDGSIDGALDVEQICFDLATIYASDLARSLVDWDKPLGLALRHSLRAA